VQSGLYTVMLWVPSTTRWQARFRIQPRNDHFPASPARQAPNCCAACRHLNQNADKRHCWLRKPVVLYYCSALRAPAVTPLTTTI
jgi:hypothetical protein